MTSLQKICGLALTLLALYLLWHMHNDITAIQDKMQMLDDRGRLLPEWNTGKFLKRVIP